MSWTGSVAVSLGSSTKAWFDPEGQAKVKVDGALQAALDGKGAALVLADVDRLAAERQAASRS